MPGGHYDQRNLNINMDAFSSEVTTAHDPNIKYGPEGEVMPGERLNYKVEYENEGKGIAFGVYFIDTLDEDLDDSSLSIGPIIDVKTDQKIGESGTYNPETRTITWFVGEVASKQGGSATFSVKVKNTTPDGSEVINYATVYFPSVPETTRTNGIVNKVTTTTDNIPPTTTASVSPVPNPSGWNNTNVTVTLSAADNQGGSGVREIHYKLTGAITEEKIISGNSVDIPIYLEGTTILTYCAIDNADSTEIAKTIILKIDKTPPTITTQTSPQPNSYSWNNTDVTITFTATDSLSGVVSVTEPSTLTTEGKEQHIGGEATDLADNKASTYVTLNIDKTPPAVKITATPNALWPPNHKLTDVTIGGSSTDNLSGIASNSFKVTDEYKTTEPLISSFNSTIKLEAWREGNDLDGRTYTISVTTRDKADNQTQGSTTVICPHDQGKK